MNKFDDKLFDINLLNRLELIFRTNGNENKIDMSYNPYKLLNNNSKITE